MLRFYLRLVLRRPAPPNALLFLFCWMLIAGTAWTDMAVVIGAGARTGGVGFMHVAAAIYSVLQMIALSRQYTLSRRGLPPVTSRARSSTIATRWCARSAPAGWARCTRSSASPTGAAWRSS